MVVNIAQSTQPAKTIENEKRNEKKQENNNIGLCVTIHMESNIKTMNSAITIRSDGRHQMEHNSDY